MLHREKFKYWLDVSQRCSGTISENGDLIEGRWSRVTSSRRGFADWSSRNGALESGAIPPA